MVLNEEEKKITDNIIGVLSQESLELKKIPNHILIIALACIFREGNNIFGDEFIVWKCGHRYPDKTWFWLETKSRNIIDCYPVGTYGVVAQLIDRDVLYPQEFNYLFKPFEYIKDDLGNTSNIEEEIYKTIDLLNYHLTNFRNAYM
jgi:hypothetical protein